MTEPVTGWRFSIDGEHDATTTRMAARAKLPVPVRGQKYWFDGLEYRVAGSEVNYNSSDSTAVAAVHLQPTGMGADRPEHQ